MLEAALGSFAELGYEGTSVRDLCRQLGVSHNLIHQRFGSKDDLWYAAVDHGFPSLLFQMMQAVVDMGVGDDLDRLRAVLVRFVEVTAASPSLIGVINQEGVQRRPPDPLHPRDVHRPGDAAGEPTCSTASRPTSGSVRCPQSVFYFLMANGATGPLTLAGPRPPLPGRTGWQARRRSCGRYAESVVDLLFDGFVIG